MKGHGRETIQFGFPIVDEETITGTSKGKFMFITKIFFT